MSKPYQNGEVAYTDNGYSASCPYKPGSREHREWEEGWNASRLAARRSGTPSGKGGRIQPTSGPTPPKKSGLGRISGVGSENDGE